MKRVALFGTSANPPTGHGGHASLVAYAAQHVRAYGAPVDEVWVLPVFRHPFASKQDLAPFEHRLAMAKLAFEDLPGLGRRVHVLDTERQVAAEHSARELGTIDVVRHLMAQHPEARFVLLLGADTYGDLQAGRWKGGRQLLDLVEVVALPRPGLPHAPATEAPWPELSDVSASRARGTNDRAVLARLLHPAVLEYIERHRLYAFGAGGS